MQRIMRSFTSCPPTDMERLFWLSLLLTHLPVTESMETAKSCLSQPNKVIWRKTGQNAVLSCTVSSHCSAKDWQYEWFSFKENSYLLLKPLDNPQKYRLEGASLRIESLHANDSGIYHCAAVSPGDPARGTQHVGMGTTLVVREKLKVMVRYILLWLLFALLSIYSVAVVTLIVKKKGTAICYGGDNKATWTWELTCNASWYMRALLHSSYGCKKMHNTNRDNSTKKRQFRDVLQEMYGRKNLERRKQTVNKSNSQVEAASTDLNGSTDDIYQNV